MTSMHPLEIDLVVQQVFAALPKSTLLVARRVCVLWHKLAAEEMEKRPFSLYHTTRMEATQECVDAFIKVMTPSLRIPEVKWILNIDFLEFSPVALLQFLSFVSSSVKTLYVAFSATAPPSPAQMSVVKDLVTNLETLDEALNLPVLESLAMDVQALHADSIPLLKPAMTLLMQTLVSGAGTTLIDFWVQFPWHKRFSTSVAMEVIACLPNGIKELNLYGSGTLSDPSYRNLIPRGFALQEFGDSRQFREGGEEVFEFLQSQKETLIRLRLYDLELQFHQQRWHGNSPKLKTLVTNVTCNSNYEFVRQFPQLHKLVIRVDPLTRGSKTSSMGHLTRIPPQHQHLSVRQLFLNLTKTLVEQDSLSLQLVSHAFPNVTSLSFFCTDKGTAMRHLPDVFKYFYKIEWFCLACLDLGTDLESALSGLPPSICDQMRISGCFDDSKEAGPVAFGLTNLTRLKTLELHGTQHHYSQVFTQVTFHHVFMKMAALKEVCFLYEECIPQPCRPFLDALRDRGIDFFRMMKQAAESILWPSCL